MHKDKFRVKDPISYKEKVTLLIFVRHGETEANKKKLIFGHLDWDLNKKGVKQIKNCTKRIKIFTKKNKIHSIITSNLTRAKHSANIIAKNLKIKNITICNDIAEKSEGILEGKTHKEFKNIDYISYKRWIKDPICFRPTNGESITDLNKRVSNFYRQVEKKYLGKIIVIVSHSGPIKLFLLKVLEADVKRFWNLRIDCGSISIVSLSKKQATINLLNYH